MNKENYKFYKKQTNQLHVLKSLTIFIYIFLMATQNLLIINFQSQIDNITIKHLNIELNTIIQFLILILLFFVFTLLFQLCFRKLSVKGKNNFIEYLYTVLNKKNFDFFQNHNDGEIASVFQNDAIALSDTLSTCNVILVCQSLSLCISTLLLIYYQPLLTLIIFSFIFICFLCTSFISQKIALLNKEVFDKKSETIQRILENIKNIKIIKQLQKENIFNSRFSNFIHHEVYPTEIKKANYEGLYICIYSLLSIGLPFLCVGIGIVFVSKDLLSVGKLIAMYTLITQTQEPIRIIADCINEKKSAYKLADKIKGIFNDENTNERHITINHINQIKINIDSFGFHNTTILKDIHFIIQKGDKYLLEGESGSGKSTLSSLIMQYLKDEDHNILINDIESNRITLESLYKHLLMVDQNMEIMEGTIKDNITMFDHFSDVELAEVIQVCQLHDLVNEKGLNYFIKPYANNLSGGQIQRICIARMLIRKPDILLLDEPTSALDEETSILFSNKLKEYSDKYNITLFIISHKKDIMNICNKRITLSHE